MAEHKIIIQHSQNPDDADGTARRLALLDRNRELAEHLFVQSAERDVLVVIVDVTDAVDVPEIDGAWVQRVVSDQMVPAMIRLLPRWPAYKGLRAWQRQLHRRDPRDPKESPVVERLKNEAPPEHFWVMVISGGKLLAPLPVPK